MPQQIRHRPVLGWGLLFPLALAFVLLCALVVLAFQPFERLLRRLDRWLYGRPRWDRIVEEVGQ